MRNGGKGNVLGVLVDAVDYEGAVARVIAAASRSEPLGVTALAVHGVMTGVEDPHHRYRLNQLDMVTPDGQPVRWALNLLHGARLSDRVYGPTLMGLVCQSAAEEKLPIFLYGSTPEVLADLASSLVRRYPGLVIAGTQPSLFRPATVEEKEAIVDRIRGSGARLTFVGLGCPRQEVFAYEYRDWLSMPVLAVGAAFDYNAGKLAQPPAWVQKAGLQWVFRLTQDPRRLWRRYLILSPRFLAQLALQWAHVWRPDPSSATAPQAELRPA